jgi:branched-chain amino acid transport system permease protein
VDLEILIENVLNAVTAGITIGCIYGLMCIGLGLIFGIMRIVNFAQGELLMLGMFASFYLVTGGRALSFLGPYWGPFVGAICAGPLLFAGGALLHKFLISRVSGLRTAGSLDEGHFGQLIVTLGISLVLQNGGQIVFGSTPVAVRTPLSAEAYLIGPLYGAATVFLNKAKLVAFFVAILVAIVLYLTLERRPRLPHRLRPGERHHGHRRRADGHVYLLRTLRRLRLRHHHVFGRRAGRHG